MAENKQSKKGFYVILILVLLLINALLFYNTFQNKTDREKLEAQKLEAEAETNRLNTEIEDYLVQLGQYKDDNVELNAIRDSLKQEILLKQTEIKKLIDSKNFSVRKLKDTEKMLGDARQQIEALIKEKDLYITQLDSIATAYNVLRVEYDTLNVRYDKVVDEREKLTITRDSISEVGSVLQAVNIGGLAVRLKKNGEESEVSRAKKTEQIKVCFDLLQNRLVGGGSQEIMLKIINPQGVTLRNESMGSGIFVNNDNGEESLYTNKYNIDFQNKESQQYCVYWNQSIEFVPGFYKAELYHKGYMVGENSFELK